MTKTIEEAAREFATKQWGKPILHTTSAIESLLIEFVRELMNLPLVVRLTEGEKERVRKIRDMYYSKWREHPNEATEAVYCAIKGTLESIFGKELFKEEV